MRQRAEKKNGTGQTNTQVQPKRRWGVIFLVFFFISAWMFFLGVLVGRNTAPVEFDMDKIRKELAYLRKQALKAEESAQKINLEKEPLEFYEVLPKKVCENDSLVTVDLKNDGISKPVNIVTKKALKKSHETVRRTIKKKENISVINHFSIQVASSRNKEDADRLVKRYIQRGFPSYMTSVEVKGTGWHRVKIGPYETLDEAESILPKVKKFKGDAFIMKHD
jgi:cell division protein FtsN